MFQDDRKSQIFYIVGTGKQDYRQIFVNIVTLSTRWPFVAKYIEDRHLRFSEIVRLNDREAIVTKLVLSLTRLSFPLVGFRCNNVACDVTFCYSKNRITHNSQRPQMPQPPFYLPLKVRIFGVIFVIRVPSKPTIVFFVLKTILQSG